MLNFLHERRDRSLARDFRARCRSGEWATQTSGQVAGFTQANLVILPAREAVDFLLFCQRNPKPCPLLEVTEIGSSEPVLLAPKADLRTDLPKYRVYEHGKLTAELTEIRSLWKPDFVAFLLGCSFTFESSLLRAGLPIRHISEGKNVPMYRTNIPCRSAGIFSGPMVVSMRPFLPTDSITAAIVTARFPQVHGAPIHWGDPKQIGISDLHRPDWGDAVTIHPGEVPVFWACGVTPQAVLLESKPPFAITHAPGHMFVTDITDEELC
jgi:uncharacterized protein YcsI (UPF0317 family)